MVKQKLAWILVVILAVVPILGFGEGNILQSASPYRFYDCTKYSENPVLPFGDNDWDYDKHYPSVLYNLSWASESRFRIWYMGLDDESNLCTCYAHSADGYDWVKPDVGRIEYGGSTSNNIILELGKAQSDVYYADGEYILLVGEDTTKVGTRHAADIYVSSSPDGIFILEKSLSVDTGYYPGIYHGFSIVKRPDGRWFVYYQYRDESDYRNIGAYLSDTTSLDGTWTDLGVLIEDVSANEQRYAIDVFTYNGKYYGTLLNYSTTTDSTWIELWDSDDGQWWNYLHDWIDSGEEGEWDGGILWQGNFVDLGDSWRYFYSGGQKTHGDYPKREIAIGFVHEALYGIEQPSCGAYLSADQAIPKRANTIVELDTKIYDIQGGFSTTNNEYVCPEDGLYLVVGQVTYRNPSNGARLITYIFKNGRAVASGSQAIGAATYTGPNCMCTIPAIAGDTFCLQTWHSCWGNENIRSGSAWTYMYVSKIG